MSIWLGISLQAFFIISVWLQSTRLSEQERITCRRCMTINRVKLELSIWVFCPLRSNFTICSIISIWFPFWLVRPGAEIGKESKNQLDHDSRFESVTQNSDSWFTDSKQAVKKVDSWFFDSKQRLKKVDSWFSASNQSLKKVDSWFTDSKQGVKKVDSRFFDSNQSLEKGRFLIHDSKQNQEKWFNCFESVDSLPISGQAKVKLVSQNISTLNFWVEAPFNWWCKWIMFLSRNNHCLILSATR